MAPEQRDVVEAVEGLPPIAGVHRTPSTIALEQMKMRRTRVRWYLIGVAAAIVGAITTAVAFRATGSYFVVISGFAMMVALAGGFGPTAIAALGSLALAFLVPLAGVEWPSADAEQFRIVGSTVLIVIGSVAAGLFRQSRLSTKERESRLERAAASVREILDGSTDAMVLTDDELRITYLNARAESMFGYAPGAAIGIPVQSLITPESLRDMPMQVTALDQGRTVRSDRTVFRADGSLMHVNISARLLSGRRLLASVRDITEQRREAERQRADRDLMDGILATSVAGILAVDTKAQIIFANRRAEQLLALFRSDPTSRTYDRPVWYQASLDGSEWPRDAQPFQRVVRTGQSVFDVRMAIVWPNGRRIALSVNGAPLRDGDGNLQGVVFAVNDITAALAAEQALRERDRQLEQITAAMPGIVYQYVIDADGKDRFVFVSQFSERLLGRSAQQLLSDVDSAWSLVHPDDEVPTKQSLMRSLHGMTPWIQEFRIEDVHSSGSWRWVSGHAVPQAGPEPGSVLWNGIFIDITDRKTLEDDLRQAQRIESVGRLAGGVAHDFNNLLTVILGQAEMLAAELPPDSSQADGIRQIRSAAESGSALTRQLLGFARKQMVAPRVIDINALVQRVPPLVGRLLGGSIALDLQLTDALTHVRVDPAQFDQVLVNLVVNARDAMPSGGRLEIQTRVIAADAPPRPEYTMLPPGPIAEICVRDTGSGMSEDVRDRAFEPFFTTKGLGKGTGLGLATSYGIVSQAGGTILIDSAVGQGTSVRVLLPVTQEPASASGAPSPAGDRVGTETVLVVDDNDAVRRVTATALCRKGYRVLQAESGAAAIEASRAEPGPIHVLVTDVAMPSMSGPDLADRLTRERPDMRVLFVTGYAEGAIADYGVPEEGATLLEKPYDIGSLTRLVRELLEGDAVTMSRE